MQKVKVTDLKVGDKVKYTNKNTYETDIGILTRIENNKYWFKWENESVEMYLPDKNNYYELELMDTPGVFTDEELIQELRNRGYSGNLNKTVTITVVV